MLTSPALRPLDIASKLRAVAPESPLLTDTNFWNCACPERFVQSKLATFCLVCGCCQHEQPDSLISEIMTQVDPPHGLPRTITACGILLAYAGQGLYPYPCKSADKYPGAAIYFNHIKCAWASQYNACFSARDLEKDTY